MARLVNLDFGGEKKPTTWATVAAVIAVYRDLAEQHNLIFKQHGFHFVYANEAEPNELTAVQFWFQKKAMPEAQLGAFNEQWYTLAVANAFTRLPTGINYYEG